MVKFPNVKVAQCGECLLDERESASSKPGVDILLFFFPFFIIFSRQETICQKVVFVFCFL